MANILIADDEPNILKLVSFFLQSSGHTIFCANNGREALAIYAAQSGNIDLVISDYIMPEGGGLDLCRELKGRCPVIIVSAMSDDNNVAQAMAAGAVDFVAKPYDLHKLRQKLSAILPQAGSA